MRKALTPTLALSLAILCTAGSPAPAEAQATAPAQPLANTITRARITKVGTGRHRYACGPACDGSRQHSVLFLETRGLWRGERLVRSAVHWDKRTDTVYLTLITLWHRSPTATTTARPALRLELPIFDRDPIRHRGLPKLVVLGNAQARALP